MTKMFCADESALEQLAIIGSSLEGLVDFDIDQLSKQWRHPLLSHDQSMLPVNKNELRRFAYDFYLKFLPYFRNQPEGSMELGIGIEVTKRMKSKLGLAYMFERRIMLNENYFSENPALLPYTLFHEMTHMWLYSCMLDPGHTLRFYNKMNEFSATGLPVDAEVHIHTKVAPESNYVYSCPGCKNCWYLKEEVSYEIFCGQCFDSYGIEHIAVPIKRRIMGASKE